DVRGGLLDGAGRLQDVLPAAGLPVLGQTSVREHALVVPDAAGIGVGGHGVHVAVRGGHGLLGRLGDVIPVLPALDEIVDGLQVGGPDVGEQDEGVLVDKVGAGARRGHQQFVLDRKSTRLNSSHVAISYAV